MANAEQYQADRLALYNELSRQQNDYVAWWQENVGIKNDGATIDESRFREPMNSFVDELLTHLPDHIAAELVVGLPSNWGREGEVLLYYPASEMGVFIALSQPEPQWGEPIPAGVAADPQKWENHLRARLKWLGVSAKTEARAFGPEVVEGLPQVPIGEGIPIPPQPAPNPWVTAAKFIAGCGLAGLVVGLVVHEVRGT